MGAPEKKPAVFEKVGECLYRYTLTGMYYGRFEVAGKEVRRSLDTTDKPTAKRKLIGLQRELLRVDLTVGKCSLAELCDRYLATVQHQKPKTVRRKRDTAAALKRGFPGGAEVSVTKVVSSRVLAWLASYDFGPPSYNLYLEKRKQEGAAFINQTDLELAEGAIRPNGRNSPLWVYSARGCGCF